MLAVQLGRPTDMPHRRTVFLQALVGTTALLGAGSAAAHHSPAMFDAAKEITLRGTVKEFQWMSPHCWIQLMVADSAKRDAPAVEWGIEMDNPLGLSRHGWKPGSLKAGEEVVVVAHPLRDGSRGAQVVAVTRADGTPVGDAPATP
jgi:Family of unknown function (DUF6152)